MICRRRNTRRNTSSVLGQRMAYVEMGSGDPIVFQHGNPTSSYLWRNIMPALAKQGRCLALDLIGMGDSDKLDAVRSRSLHARRTPTLLRCARSMRSASRDNVTLVLHDWGSALGFDWASRHRDALKGICYMEAIVRPLTWARMAGRGNAGVQGISFGGGRRHGVGEERLRRTRLARVDPAQADRRRDGGVSTSVRDARRRSATDADVAAPDSARRRTGGRRRSRARTTARLAGATARCRSCSSTPNPAQSSSVRSASSAARLPNQQEVTVDGGITFCRRIRRTRSPRRSRTGSRRSPVDFVTAHWREARSATERPRDR